MKTQSSKWLNQTSTYHWEKLSLQLNSEENFQPHRMGPHGDDVPWYSEEDLEMAEFHHNEVAEEFRCPRCGGLYACNPGCDS